MPGPCTLADLKPFLWMALAAFLVGFVSFLFLGEGSRAVAREPAHYASAASAPSSDEWNLPKRI
jgi:hypothetical protein